MPGPAYHVRATAQAANDSGRMLTDTSAFTGTPARRGQGTLLPTCAPGACPEAAARGTAAAATAVQRAGRRWPASMAGQGGQAGPRPQRAQSRPPHPAHKDGGPAGRAGASQRHRPSCIWSCTPRRTMTSSKTGARAKVRDRVTARRSGGAATPACPPAALLWRPAQPRQRCSCCPRTSCSAQATPAARPRPDCCHSSRCRLPHCRLLHC